MNTLRDAPHKGEKHLIWGFVFILLLMQAVVILVVTELTAVNRETSQILETQREKSVQVSTMRDAMRKRQVGLRDMVILADPFLKDEAWQTYFRSATDFILARARLEELGLSDEEKVALSRLSERASDAYATQQAVVDMVQAGDPTREISPLLQAAIASQQKAADEMGNLIRMQHASAQVALETAEQRYQEKLWLLIAMGALASFSAILIAMVALSRDRRLVGDLDNYRDHLQELVAERTRQLQSMVTELESFSYSLAHDLRQPLRGLDGFSMILLEDYGDQLDATGQDYLRRIRAGSQRIGKLLDGMLTLCHLSRTPIQREEIDLSTLCHEIAEANTAAGERDIQLTIADHMTVCADPNMMHIAMENLISNSLKFTAGKDPACIEIGCSVDSPGQVYFIRDNGVGFDMRYSHKVFGVFERLHGADEFDGAGIGLATVSRIIERHGGKIWVDAEPGAGAVFYFTLNEAAGQPVR